MVVLTNTPLEHTVIDLEVRKSFALRVALYDRHGNELPWEDMAATLTAGEYDSTDVVLEADGDEGIFRVQAEDLDLPPGAYPFVVVLRSRGYSLVIVKGELKLHSNPESASVLHYYGDGMPSETLGVRLDGMNVIQVSLRNTPLTLGSGGGGGGTAVWSEIIGKPDLFPPAQHTHDTSDIGGLTSTLAAVQSSLDGKSPLSHTHSISHITALQAALDGKSFVGHKHAILDTTGLQTALDAKAPLSHAHSIADVTNLQTTLNGKAATSHAHVIGDVSGLLPALNAKADTGHTHLVAQVSGAIRSVNGYNPDINGNVVIPVGDPSGNVNWDNVFDKPDTFPPSAHTHDIADTTGLQTTLDGKAATSHTHTIANVTNLQTTLDGKASTSHTHTIANVTGLQAALDGKQVAGSYAAIAHGHDISDVTGLQTALDGRLTASGLQDAMDDEVVTLPWAQVTSKPATYPPSTHSHAWSEITSKPSTFPPSTHTHSISNISSLQTALDGKAPINHDHIIDDVAGLQAALNSKADANHTHSDTGVGTVGSSYAGTIVWARANGFVTVQFAVSRTGSNYTAPAWTTSQLGSNLPPAADIRASGQIQLSHGWVQSNEHELASAIYSPFVSPSGQLHIEARWSSRPFTNGRWWAGTLVYKAAG